MQIARTFWFTVALVSLGAIIMVFDNVPFGEGGKFILAEFGLFAIAFMATLVSGRGGWVLSIGVGLGFLFATLLSIGTSASCGEGDFICLSPGEVFVFGLLGAGVLYPGWAFGVGVGNLVRGMSTGGSNR
jgi:hypothetical protein